MKIKIEKSLNHRQAFEEEININKKADERYFRFFVCIFLVNTYEIVNFYEILALCQMMLVKRNLRIIWTEQKEENLF
ncbi:hypothetical protein DVW00_02390, partial [Enterococcus faecium]